MRRRAANVPLFPLARLWLEATGVVAIRGSALSFAAMEAGRMIAEKQPALAHAGLRAALAYGHAMMLRPFDPWGASNVAAAVWIHSVTGAISGNRRRLLRRR